MIVLAARSISEEKRIRYLLGLSFPAEREQIESEYFENEAAFQDMLQTEDDLIDAYARGELVGEERRRFEKTFVSSFRGSERVQFARALADVAFTTRPFETKLIGKWLDIFQASGGLRTATIAPVVVLVMVSAWLVIDRPMLTNKLPERRTESTEQGQVIQPLQRSSDAEPTGVPKKRAQIIKSRVQLDKQAHREGVIHVTQRAPHFSAEPLSTYSLVHENASRSEESAVRGTAKDSNGNLVSGATVTLTNPATHFIRTQMTGKDGSYVFNAIPQGTYSLTIRARGFKTASASDLVALVDTPTVRDIQLEVVDVTETVDVTAAAEALVNTSDATLGNSFKPVLITELPLNANNVAGLLSLQPGVSSTGSVSGARSDQSKLLLDTVDAGSIPGSFNWFSFKVVLETPATHETYRITIKTAGGRLVSSVDWSATLTPNQVIIDTPVISTSDLPPGDYVLSLMGKEPDGSFIKIAEYTFKIIDSSRRR